MSKLCWIGMIYSMKQSRISVLDNRVIIFSRQHSLGRLDYECWISSSMLDKITTTLIAEMS